LQWHYGWSDPYWGMPHGAYRYGYTSRRYVRESDENSYDSRLFGSVRLRVDPKDAKVYVDGALAGIVDEFDGLTDHLQLEAGAHEIELRADGYETTTVTVDVDAGKTRTARVNLKRR
jgi:hypothetical protein